MQILLSEIDISYIGQLLSTEPHLLLETGNKYSIQAPSGVGKSTLMHVLYGLHREYVGSYTLDGKNIKDFTIDEWVKIRQSIISVVFQGFRLIQDLTVKENIEIKSSLSNFPGSKIFDYATTLGIIQLMDNKVSNLSFGQQQRVALLRALCQPFKWLLLDEAFSHLDKHNAEKAIQLIIECVDNNNAGLIVAETKPSNLLINFKPVLINDYVS